jgi:mono/diheme cytochrome c family protein
MFQRLLIDRMENRIIVGTLSFLGILVLTGWIAINEGARMRAFDEQFLARSIERGAALFSTNCTECHGLDGRGITGMAPGLNNPALFGYNPFAEIDASIVQLEAEQSDMATDEPGSEDRLTEIATELAGLQAQRAQLEASLQQAVERGYDPAFPSRLAQLGWTSTRDSFIFTTLIHGRPNSGTLYPAGKVMPAWSQLANGPLRTGPAAY